MKTVSSTEVKNTFGTVMDLALVEPVLVKKSGRSSVVILSAAEYERLTAMEDAYWAGRALSAEAAGFASSDQVKRLIEDAQGA
ncbi:MAG: type II toxin-antitoxin system prevent-host-death family antitoxin [Cyanobacteria bacterium REEB67]|nr:type II toxin-antitoxin system prevent-host-death family antitoxin [Cyanobacteria bacterium REEB67]